MPVAAGTIDRPVRTIRARRDQHDDAGSVLFGVLWDAGRITWDDDVAVLR
jgi:hypothetical protein